MARGLGLIAMHPDASLQDVSRHHVEGALRREEVAASSATRRQLGKFAFDGLASLEDLEKAVPLVEYAVGFSPSTSSQQM